MFIKISTVYIKCTVMENVIGTIHIIFSITCYKILYTLIEAEESRYLAAK